jgi:hypothetical protein
MEAEYTIFAGVGLQMLEPFSPNALAAWEISGRANPYP